MTTPRICIPVTGTTVAELVKHAKEVSEQADIIELRADYATDIHTDQLSHLKISVSKPILFTCRAKNEGGKFEGSEEERITIIQKAIDTGFAYVDVELDTIKTHAFHRMPDSKLIVSYHKFSGTPDYWDITKIIDEMASYHPDIMKIATMVTREEDVQTLLRVLANKKPHQDIIVIGMGEQGVITRIIGPLMGSYLTFASQGKEGTAPGQIHVGDMKKLYNTISSIV